MKKFVLFCKSYRNDLFRLKRLAESVQKNNSDKIDFYVSVPSTDRELFNEALIGLPVRLITDEEIVRANPALDQAKVGALPGGVSQQIIKSEFWRLDISESYLCIDSDCAFIRQFHESDFITPAGVPYTVIHEAKSLLQFCERNNMRKVHTDFVHERQKIMNTFNRTGRIYDYGPAPLLWHRSVWQALDEKLLKPRNLNFYDAILSHSSEILWYGESLLKFQTIPLIPAEPLFKYYLYERQFIAESQQGESTETLAQNYLGVGYQSNWDRKFDFQKKPILSRIVRWAKRYFLHKYA